MPNTHNKTYNRTIKTIQRDFPTLAMNKFGQTLVPETSMKEGKLLTLLDKLEEQLGHLPTCSK